MTDFFNLFLCIITILSGVILLIIIYYITSKKSENFDSSLNLEGVKIKLSPIQSTLPAIVNTKNGLKVPNSYSYIDNMFQNPGLISDSGEKEIDSNTKHTEHQFNSIKRIDAFKNVPVSLTDTSKLLNFESKKEF